jgi:hypothetical protein
MYKVVLAEGIDLDVLETRLLPADKYVRPESSRAASKSQENYVPTGPIDAYPAPVFQAAQAVLH